MYFCAKCADVICEQCKNTIHTDHLKKGFIFEYTEFINQSQISISQYRDKFIKYNHLLSGSGNLHRLKHKSPSITTSLSGFPDTLHNGFQCTDSTIRRQ